MKRFQECNKLVKTWRYRHYVYIPFKWVWHQYVKPFYVTSDETLLDERVNGKMLWRFLIGTAQHDMGWYYTWDEVKNSFKEKYNMDDYIDLEDDIDESEYYKK